MSETESKKLVSAQECEECHALVVNMERHAGWHASLKPEAIFKMVAERQNRAAAV